MIEKLLENWLDSASERSYQPVFVQMLAAEGYKVVHSTRHCLQEYGKDILAVAPDGVGCAFQLKGDPGHKMNVSQFRNMQAQLVQLMAQRPSYPGFPVGPHRAYLVSNGQFSEEVQFAAHEMNNANYTAKLELWSRGELLALCKKHGLSLWPSEIRDNRALLEIYMANRRDPLSVKTLNDLLSSILSLGTDEKALKPAAFTRSVASAVWATGICLSNFAEAKNHYAVSIGWSLCQSLLLAAASKHDSGKLVRIEGALEQCALATLDALSALWEEVSEREHLTSGSPLMDAEIYGWRVGVLLGLMSSLASADAKRGLLDPESSRKLVSWLTTTGEKPDLWGEGAIANLLPWILFLNSNGAIDHALSVLTELTGKVIELNQPGAGHALPTPHYSFEEVKRDSLGLRHGTTVGIHDKETFAGAAFTADALFKLLALYGLKEEAKQLWPPFSKLSHRYMEMSEPWHYFLLNATEGGEATRIYPHTYEWHTVEQDIAAGMMKEPLLPPFQSSLWMLFMWWQVAPHRVTSTAAVGAANALLTAADEELSPRVPVVAPAER